MEYKADKDDSTTGPGGGVGAQVKADFTIRLAGPITSFQAWRALVSHSADVRLFSARMK